jgi:glutaredoxin-related protein
MDSRTEFAVARHLLDEAHLHPAIRSLVASHHLDTVQAVQAAMTQNRVVIVGMAGNPVVSKARDSLQAHKIAYKYLEYGSYFSQWRRRTALKMWTGWPTFPMVFVDGILVGGYKDLQALIDSGELATMIGTAAV